MKIPPLLAIVVGLGALTCGFSAQAEHVTKIIGLVNMADWKAAWLEMTDSPSDRAPSMTSRQFVKEGQSFDDTAVNGAHVHVEILQIDFTNGIVKANEDGKDTVYEVKKGDNTGNVAPAITLRWDHMEVNQILDTYANLTGRTALIHPGIPRPGISAKIIAWGKAEAAGILEIVLREKGISFIPDGDKFELVVPERLEKATRSNLQNSPPPKPDTSNPGFSLIYQGVDVDQVLTQYGKLVGKKMEAGVLPHMAITLKTQTPLTKAEVVHALDTLLAWRGIKVVNVDEKTVKAVAE